jgi:hypothetical protein
VQGPHPHEGLGHEEPNGYGSAPALGQMRAHPVNQGEPMRLTQRVVTKLGSDRVGCPVGVLQLEQAGALPDCGPQRARSSGPEEAFCCDRGGRGRRGLAGRPRRLYFDNNATTPLLPRVRDGMFEASTVFGNPSSAHLFGEEAAERVEEARRAVAELLGCPAEQVVFNSGGSEGASSAILGAGLTYRADGGHIITSAVEHPAVLGSCEFLVSLGFDLTVLPVDGAGRVEPGSLRRALRRDTRLVSVMHANNETGTLQPVEELAQVAREAGVTFHCDAVQSAGKVPIPVGQGLITISAHKFHGPKGVGATVNGTDASLQRLVFGGEQEYGLRPGTENVLGSSGSAWPPRLHGCAWRT